MGFLKDVQKTNWREHTIEVQSNNHFWNGIVYSIHIDGREVARAENPWKIPTRRTLETRWMLQGRERQVVVEVQQRWLSVLFELFIDGEPVPLQKVV